MTTLDGQPAYTDAERNAMRAYLQRCEVRLSTLHRIATAFISGAGLLLLIPVFFKDAIASIITVLLEQAGNQFPQLGTSGLLLTALLYLALGYPLLLSLAIPLYGVYLLLKDMVHFYFTIYTPGFSENLLNPTFALTGILFSVDESQYAKHEVMRHEYQATRQGFMIPFSQERSERYFEDVIVKTSGHIVPESRQLEKLKTLGVLPEKYDEHSINQFNAALGIARSLDRTLAGEVAVMEMALVRHVLYLRRLMLRYVKTLLMFIWTTLIAFMLLPFLRDSHVPPLLMMALGYLAWSIAVRRIINLPIYWIYRHRHGELNPDHIDPQVTHMQHVIERFAVMSVIFSLVAVGLTLVSFLGG